MTENRRTPPAPRELPALSNPAPIGQAAQAGTKPCLFRAAGWLLQKALL